MLVGDLLKSSEQSLTFSATYLSGLVAPVWCKVTGRDGRDSPAAAQDAAEGTLPRTSGRAAKINKALRTVHAGSWQDRVIASVSVLELGGVAAAVGQYLSPKGPGCCDNSELDRVVNVLTSIPFVLVGIEAHKNRHSSAGKLWGASIAGVGVASGIFHASRGRWRAVGRKLDYWAIALSSTALTRTLFPTMPRQLTVSSVVATPVRPFLVSMANAVAGEVAFLQAARADPARLGLSQRLHSAAALASLGMFALEEAFPHTPLIHATWHCLSAYGCCGISKLIEYSEEQRQCQQVHAGRLCTQRLLTEEAVPLHA